MSSSTVEAAQRAILREKEVCERVGLRPTSIDRLIAAGKFPRPVKLTGKAKGWLASEVDAWIASRAADRDRAA